MKHSTVFRCAAGIMAHPEFRYGCCGAIDRAAGGQTGNNFCRLARLSTYAAPSGDYFADLFRQKFGFWWTDPSDPNSEEDRTPRVLALLLAAEIAASEGL